MVQKAVTTKRWDVHAVLDVVDFGGRRQALLTRSAWTPKRIPDMPQQRKIATIVSPAYGAGVVVVWLGGKIQHRIYSVQAVLLIGFCAVD